ncbi:MAG: glycosyltransferase [Latilactobacillus curvatus]
MEKYTVLMSLYKKERPENLILAIESMIQQTIKPSEFLIIADGDLTEELDLVLNHYDEEYNFFKILRLKENVGLGVALNIGVRESKYELIVRMDSDDISKKNRCEKQIEFLENNQEIDVLGTFVSEFIGSIDNVINEKKVPTSFLEIKKYSNFRNPINHMSVVFKKSSVIQSGNYRPMQGFEDYYLWLRMLQDNRVIVNLDDYLVFARTEKDFYKRRSGWNYFLQEINFQNKIRKEKIITNSRFIKNLVLRGIVRLIPARCIKMVYNTMAR